MRKALVLVAASLAASALPLSLVTPASSAESDSLELWTTTVSKVVSKELEVVGPAVVVAGTFVDYSEREGVQVTAMSRRTGATLWTYRFALGEKSRSVDVRGSFDGERVYVRARTRVGPGELVDSVAALSTVDGGQLWQRSSRLASSKWSGTALLPIGEGVIVATGHDGLLTPWPDLAPVPTPGPDCHLVALGSAGQTFWSRSTSMSCSGGDATATGRVVIAGAVLRPDGDGYTRHVTSRGLTPSDGSTTWRRTNKRASEGRAGVLISPDGRTALVSELVSAGEERWLALATSTGHQQWSTTPVGIGGIWSPNGSRVYVRETNTRSDQGQIERAYDGATGDLLWRTNDRTLADYNDMVAVPGRLLLVGQRFFWIEAPCGCEADLETQTWIVSLSARDGSREWRVPFGERGRHQPGVARTDAGVDVDPSRPETAYIAGKLWPNGFASAFMTS